MHTLTRFRPAATLSALALTLILAACGDGNGNGGPPPPQVGTLTAQAQAITPVAELPGRLEAWRIAEVRARVAGIVQERRFTEGSDVKAGDLLYRIDPAPYQAAVSRAQAELSRAEANHFQARSQSKRIQALRQTGVVSEQDAINAQADEKQAEAAAEAARAALKTARIDLDYANVTAPIDGRVGRALVTEGALVGQGEATPLAVVQQIDRLYVGFTQSAREVLQLRQSLASGERTQQGGVDSLPVQLILEDGSTYAQEGRLLFTDLSVDSGTARVSLRAEVPNPDKLLLPGMFVRVRIQQAAYPAAFRVPQQAVFRNENGDLMRVLTADNQVEDRFVTVAGTVDKDWIITTGLSDGERFVVDGFQKIRPGAPVDPVAWNGAATH